MDQPTVAAPSRTVLKGVFAALVVLAVTVSLVLASRYSYLLFHGISEIFSIVIMTSVFMISWSSRSYPEARPFVILGIGFLFVAVIDVFHTLSYQGMNVLSEGFDYPTRLWVAARGLQALTVLAFAILLRARRTAPSLLLFALFTVATAVLLATIFFWNVFPMGFVKETGLTPFKKVSEYAISAILTVAILIVMTAGDVMNPRTRTLLVISFGLTILSELTFTLYSNVYGTQNLIGHMLKIASCALAYQALFSTEVKKRIAAIEELERAKAALEKSEKGLREANASKDKFFSIIAHDLRNPIGGLLTLSELLTKRYDQLAQDKIKEFCHLIYDGARQGADLLDSLLQWARAQTGRIEYAPRPLGLASLCRDCADLLAPQADGKSICMEQRVAEGATAFADENMIRAVMRNLLSNAVKFTPRGGRILIASGVFAEEVELTVKDSGVGMSPEALEKLFRIDTHLATRGTEEERGNGLGLLICKEFVELNHGSISVHSSLGEGSTFTVRLPRGKPASQRISA